MKNLTILILLLCTCMFSCAQEQVRKDKKIKSEIGTEKEIPQPVELKYSLDSIYSKDHFGSKGQFYNRKTLYFYDFEKNIDTLTKEYVWVGEDENGEWQLKSLRKSYISEDNKDTLVVNYSEYIPEKKKFAKKVVFCKNAKSRDLRHPVRYDKFWLGKKKSLKLNYEEENRLHSYSYEWDNFKKDTSAWTSRMKTTSFLDEKKQIVETYDETITIYQGNKRESFRKRLFTYQDTLLKGNISFIKNNRTDKDWIKIRREFLQYDQYSNLIDHEKQYWKTKDSVWVTNWREESKRLNEKGDFIFRTFYEIHEDYGYIPFDKTIYTYDENDYLVKKDYYTYDNKEKALDLDYSEVYSIDEQGNILENQRTNFDNRGYDNVLYTNTYDAKGRLLTYVHQNKQKNATNWRYIRGKKYEYKFADTEEPTFYEEHYSPSFFIERRNLEFDSLRNLINVDIQYKGGKEKSNIIYLYHDGIKQKEVLMPRGKEKSIRKPYGEWELTSLMKEYSIQRDGAKSSGAKYFYSPIKK